MAAFPAKSSLYERAVQDMAARLIPRNEVRTGTIQLSDLKIRTKDRALVPFSPNKVQAMYLDAVLPEWRQGKYSLSTIRDIVLKARQEGITTLWAILYFLETISVPYTQAVIIAHTAESTEKIFQIIRRLYDNLPEDKKPETKYASKREYYWPQLDSSFYVGTAGDRDFGRGQTVNLVHGSEVASWPDAQKIVAALLQCVPTTGCVVLESTAQGVGDYFNTEYMLALEGESSFTARFFGWNQNPEYSLPILGSLSRTEEEEKLATQYALSNEQLAWRREKIKELKGDFVQEYPINPEEAFLSTGNAYFSQERLKEMLLAVVPSLESRSLPARLSELRPHQLEVYVTPTKGHTYCLAADTAEGVDEDGRSDFDSADVYDMETYEQVAHLHGKWDTHFFGLLLADLGTWYNVAWLGVERNNHGHAVINAILHSTDYPRMTVADPNKGLYYHREYDEKRRMRVRKPGWPTTPKTKFFALDQLASLVEIDEVHINSKGTIREMMTFTRLPGGKAGGQPGMKDDRVISSSIFAGMMALRQKPITRARGWRGKSGKFV